MGKNFVYSPKLMSSHGNIYTEHISIDYVPELAALPYMLLIYAAHSRAQLLIDDNRENVSEGDVFLIRPNSPHAFYSVDKTHIASVYVCAFYKKELPFQLEDLEKDFPAIVDFLSGKRSYLHIHDNPSKDIRYSLVRLMDGFLYREPCAKQYVKSYLTIAVINTLKIASINKIYDSKPKGNAAVGRAINYINYNIYKKISCAEIAKLLHMTQEHLSRIFRRETGMTITDFANTARVEIIKDILKNTNRPIHLICEDFDFSSEYIKKLFRRYTGYSLHQYKKMYNYIEK